MPLQINPKTNRLHTHFSQVSTSTGRLSSIEPNLQNIPIRTVEGNKIRKSFIAPPGEILISADYSQIELRVLAHIADIKSMQQAFKENKDIHSMTASRIFNIDPEDVGPEQRRKAKAINFGIIYGISSFGLAKQLQITKESATAYIKDYFNKYPEIETYFQKTKEFAYKNGYVKNIFGRRSYIQYINDRSYHLKNFAYRAAINAPIQSSASDITKIAMLNLYEAFKYDDSVNIILQIHDEILLTAKELTDELLQTINNCMVDINVPVPLVVDINSGKNWGDLKI